ncbi:O-antigen ligase family protein [Enterobacillus tribolii]|nr:O-antigen ligase family protein [Enterobacillus tribolii]MBW7981070.1 O-antigen ligase family protein [Enterobacillus tribolii]
MTNIKNVGPQGMISGALLASFTLFALSFYALAFYPEQVRKVFYTTGYFVVLLMIVFFKKMEAPKENKILASSVALFALSILVWSLFYKNHGAFKDVYYSYEASGRILLFSSLILFALSNFKFYLPAKPFYLLLIAGGFCVNAYAIYQGAMTSRPRVELAFDRATMAAYIMTLIDLFLIYAVLQLPKKWSLILLAPAVLISFGGIVYTETRAAILAYPILVFLQLCFHRGINKKLIFAFSGICVAIIAITIVIFHAELNQRLNELNNDIRLYEEQNSNSSVGARLVMFETGLHAGLQAPQGESAETRSEHIKQQIATTPALSGAAEYLDVHMHNELIDNFSLRGIWGAAALLFFYCALLFTAWRDKNTLLFVITLSVMVYGLSDVLFFSREGTIIVSLAVILAVILEKPEHNLIKNN